MADADMDADATFAALEAELSRRRPIASRLRQHLIRLKGGVPSSLRLQLWRNLLGLQRAQLSSSTVQRASLERASKQELENQRVIVNGSHKHFKHTPYTPALTLSSSLPMSSMQRERSKL